MQVLSIGAVLLLALGAVLAGGYFVYRRGLRYAKGIERGIKMVPVLINLPPPSEDVEIGGRDVRDVIQERISQAEVLYNLIASTATKGFKSKFFGQRHIGFELIAVNGTIQFYAAVPVAMVDVIKQAILTAYPGANLEEVEDHNVFNQTGKISGTFGGELVLKQDYPYPIATFDQLKRNTMEGIINSLTSLEEGDGAGIQILLRPAREEWAKNAESLAKEKREDKGDAGFSFKHILQAPFKVPEGSDGKEDSKSPKQLSNLEQTVADSIEEKAKSTGYEVLVRVIASSGTASRAQVITNNIVSSFSLFDAQGMNGFTFRPAKNMEQFVTDFIFRFFPPERKKMILNSVELSTIFHLPDAQFTQTSQVQRQYSKQVEGPSQLSQEGLLIGYNVYRGVKKQIRISDNDRRRHVYIVGQTGTGKSVLLENMMVQDMRAGKGFAFIDPHGDAAEKVLGIIPRERSEDVIYFNPGEMDHPPGLNLFEYHTEDQKDFLIQETLNMLYKLYDPQQQGIIGPRYEHMFRNAALTVMADPNGGTFIDIPKLFRDSQFVKEKLKYVEDKTVQEFWQKEIPQAQRSSDFGEMMSWFVSKFGAFLSNQMMRNIIGQPKSSFDLREVMDSRKILIANLSKGRLGELNSMLLGMIFVMKFQAAAMSRANQPEDERIDFSFYIDEFQNFSTDSFAFILSEARKYHLNMIVANQFISQLSEEIREAVFGNVGTIVSLRTGPNDADFLVKQFSPTFNDRDLVNLPNYHAAVRLMSQGLPTQPFNMTTLPPLGESHTGVANALKQLSNAKYGRPRQEVENEIFDRLSTKPPPNPYESLASSQGGGPSSMTGSAPQQPSGAGGVHGGSQNSGSQSGSKGGSSFLDEWLAKRRAASGGGGQSGQPGEPSSSTGSPQSAAGAREANSVSYTQNQQSTQASPRSDSQDQHSSAEGDSNRVALSGADTYQVPDQPSHAGSSPDNTRASSLSSQQTQSQEQSQFPQLAQTDPDRRETVVQPPQEDEKHSAREELLAALDSDGANTRTEEVGRRNVGSASSQAGDTAQQKPSSPQQPNNPLADTVSSSSVESSSGAESVDRAYGQPPQQERSSAPQPETADDPSRFRQQPRESQTPQSGQKGQEVNSMNEELTDEYSIGGHAAHPSGAEDDSTEEHSAQIPDQQESSSEEVADPGDTITPSSESGTGDMLSPQSATHESQPGNQLSPATDTLSAQTAPGEREDELQSGQDLSTEQSGQSDHRETMDTQNVSQQVASDLGVELSQEQTDDQISQEQAAPTDESRHVAAPTDKSASRTDPGGKTSDPQSGEVYVDDEGNVHQG